MIQRVRGGWVAGWSRALADYDAAAEDPHCICLSTEPGLEGSFYLGDRRYAYVFPTRAQARAAMREFRATRVDPFV